MAEGVNSVTFNYGSVRLSFHFHFMSMKFNISARGPEPARAARTRTLRHYPTGGGRGDFEFFARVFEEGHFGERFTYTRALEPPG